MEVPMGKFWPFKTRRQRIADDWEKVQESLQAAEADRKALIEMAEKRAAEAGITRREAYSEMLTALLNRKLSNGNPYPG
jgi:hypothetical protein